MLFVLGLANLAYIYMGQNSLQFRFRFLKLRYHSELCQNASKLGKQSSGHV